LFTFNIQKNPPSLNVVNAELIPRVFYEEQEPKLNRRELLNFAKESDIPGVEVMQNESLRIR